jgi:hypothetical protein
MGAGSPGVSSPTKRALAAEKVANVPQIRDDLINTLTHAIAETNSIANKADVTAEKGAGGMPSKARWYQLLGYLVQVLDGVCKNVELSEINERLAKVESELNIAPARTSKTSSKS